MSDYPTTPPPPPPFGAGPEPTQPIGGGTEPTQHLPVAPPPEHLGGGTAAAGRPARGRRGFAAGLLVAALVVGGGAGVGGAAIYDAVDDDAPAGTGTSTSDDTDSSQVADTPDRPAADGSVEQVAGRVLPSVVRLDVVTGQGQATGSGVVLSADGEILTNDHVVSGADDGEITVHFNDGSTTTASIVGTDPLTDTALIQAEDVDGLTPITLGKSEDLDVGEQVVAIGSPFGLTSTVTSGIVSALDRPVDVGTDEEGTTTAYPAIQTDAAINPGNSGGALVDMNGNLVGINSSIRTSGTSTGGASGSIGLGFAIAIDDILPLVEQMRAGETPTHARLGITVSDVGDQQGTPEIPGQGGLGGDDPALLEGAEVVEVTEGSAAEDAGLESGDIITRVDDHVITDKDALIAIVRSYRPGDEVTISFRRDGEEQETTLTLGSDAD